MGGTITKANADNKRIVILGNSLSYYDELAGALRAGGMRFPTTLYTGNIVALGKKISLYNLSLGGIQTSQQITNFPTNYKPYIRPGDIVIWWEFRNDLRVLDNLASAQANVVTMTNLIKATGAKCVMLDMIAGDGATDPVDFQTLWGQANAWANTNQATLCDLLIRVSTIPELDAIGDTTNATYYIQGGDKVHLTNAGYDLVAAFVYAALNTANYL